MFKAVSKSVNILFLFDFLVFTFSSVFCLKNFNLPSNINIICCGAIIATGLISLFLKGNYKIQEFNPNISNLYKLFEGCVFAHIPAFIIIFYMDKISLLKFLLLNLVLIYAFLCCYRLIFHYYLFNYKRVKNVLILGTDERARVTAEIIKNKFALKMRVVGFIQGNINKEEFSFDESIPILKNIESLDAVIKEKKVDIIVIAQPTKLITTIIQNVKIYKMPDFYEMVTYKYYIDEKTMTELYYRFMIHHSYFYDVCKRLFDIIAALIILFVTFPIVAFIAIRVKLTDGGNPIYTQTRVGINGKTFKCYKLRTMYANKYVPNDETDIKYAENKKDDDRIIPFCKFARKARFDEIPQMINILKGEMSIVGPRAEWEKEVEIFKKQIPYYSCRMWIKTGWTGWSHINMNPVFTLEEEKERLEYDLYYIKHRNILWDFAILVKAVFLACGGRHK